MVTLNDIENLILCRDSSKLTESIQELMSIKNAIITSKEIVESENLLITSVVTIDKTIAVLDNAMLLFAGKHLEIINDSSLKDLSVLNLRNLLMSSNNDPLDSIQELILDMIISQESESEEVLTALQLLILGITYLEIFLQMNYSGPELSQSALEKSYLLNDDNSNKVFVSHLECDGNYAFPMVQVPQCLVISRIILSTLANPTILLWKFGINLDINGIVSRKNSENSLCEIIQNIVSRNFVSITWHSARCSMIHVRALQTQNYSVVPSLWVESQSLFNKSVEVYTDKFSSNVHLMSQLFLEWGLCHHFFEYQDKVY